MRYFLILLISCLVSFAYAETEQEKLKDSRITQAGLIPLTVGNRWVYINKKTNTQSESAVEKVQYVNGQYWFKYNELGESFWVRNEGLNQYEALDYFDEEEISGEVVNEALVLTVSKTNYTFSGIEKALSQPCKQPIKVPAGTFNCQMIRFDFGDGHYAISYYAENIGLLKNILNSENGYSEVELLEYTLQ